MSEYLTFTYKSIGNFCHLLLNVQYEKTHTSREIAVFHQRFDNDKTDSLIEEILIKLYPEGVIIGEKELVQLTSYIENFMIKDKETQDLFVEYDKRHYVSYVYFKPDNKVVPVEFGKHTETVKNICLDYFKDFQSVDIDFLEKFLKENFEVSSDFTTIDDVIADVRYIALEIVTHRGNKYQLY